MTGRELELDRLAEKAYYAFHGNTTKRWAKVPPMNKAKWVRVVKACQEEK